MARSWPSMSVCQPFDVCCVCVCVCVCVPSVLYVCRPATYTKTQRRHTHRWVNKAIVYYFVFYYAGRD